MRCSVVVQSLGLTIYVSIRLPGVFSESQALRGTPEDQKLIAATLLVFTTEACILWYVSLGSQYVILLPNQATSVSRRKVVSVMRNFISVVHRSAW